MGDYAPYIQALASLVSAGGNVYGGIKQGMTPTGGPKLPQPDPNAGALEQAGAARAILPQARANAAAGVGGGISPEFLANLVASESGSPQGALDILGEIRRGMNPQV